VIGRFIVNRVCSNVWSFQGSLVRVKLMMLKRCAGFLDDTLSINLCPGTYCTYIWFLSNVLFIFLF
jgi:hypothetical protein